MAVSVHVRMCMDVYNEMESHYERAIRIVTFRVRTDSSADNEAKSILGLSPLGGSCDGLIGKDDFLLFPCFTSASLFCFVLMGVNFVFVCVCMSVCVRACVCVLMCLCD